MYVTKYSKKFSGKDELTGPICHQFVASWHGKIGFLLHFVAFFHVASLFSTRVDNKKVGVDNKKALELTNSTVFHRGRQ